MSDTTAGVRYSTVCQVPQVGGCQIRHSVSDTTDGCQIQHIVSDTTGGWVSDTV